VRKERAAAERRARDARDARYGDAKRFAHRQARPTLALRLLLTPIAIALLTGVGGSAPQLKSQVQSRSTTPCAFFTRNGEILHLWLFPSNAAYDELEIGLSPRAGTQSRPFRVFPLDPISPGLPRWRLEHGAYARASKTPEGLWFADSGEVSIRVLQPDHLGGHYALALSAFIDGTTNPPHLHAEGDFAARRDTLYERYVYRRSAQSDSPPQHLCSRRAPA